MNREMLAVDVLLRRARIADASALVKEGVLSMSTKDAQEYLRIASLDDSVMDYYCSGFFARVTSAPDDSSRKFLKINTSIADYDELYPIMEELVRKCLFKDNGRKLSIMVTVSDEIIERVIDSLGFVQEALLRDEILKVVDGKKLYQDAGLFSMQRAEFTRYNVCFVPFQRGVVAVTGGDNYVDNLQFLNYESSIEDELIFDAAWYQGLVDDNGLLLSRTNFPWDASAEDYMFMPAELIRTHNELKEYFHKQRDTFDINVKIYEGTKFQIDVWEQLRSIPYGVTCSYEDIALKLTNNDLKQARKLTRAVGKACSENPVPIIVPCHRVIGKNGMLIGFSGGIEFKDFLLQNELFAAALPLN